jgi:hypothetical protein
LHAGGQCGGAIAEQIVVGLYGGEAVGRIAQLCLRSADLLFEQLRLLARLGQKRFELLVVAVERGSALLILLRLLRECRLLLRSQRDGRRLTSRCERIPAATASSGNEREQCERASAQRSMNGYM